MSAAGKRDQVRNQNANLRDEVQKKLTANLGNQRILLAIYERLGDILVRMEDQ